MAASVPCKKSCVCGPFYKEGKINYPLWWYGDQGILYNFAGGSATPNGCVFKDHGYWFDGNDDYLIDEQNRKILKEGTAGLWSSLNLDCDNPPPCGSVTGSGTVLYLNKGNDLPPKLSGSLILYPEYCPNLTHLNCYWNSFSGLDVAILINLIDLNCYGNSLSVLDVAALVNLTTLNVSANSLSVLDVAALVNLEQLHCYNNSISVLDIAALTSLTFVRCYGNSISILDTSLLSSLTNLQCQSNSMNQAMVDTVLCDMDGHGTNNGTLNISSNAVPSAAGIMCKNNLIGRGWTVTTD